MLIKTFIKKTYCSASCEKGQALVESILVMAILIGILASIVYFGKLGNDVHKAFMGARIMSLATNQNTGNFAFPTGQANFTTTSVNQSIINQLQIPQIMFTYFTWLNENIQTGRATKNTVGYVIGSENSLLSPLSTHLNITASVTRNSWKFSGSDINSMAQSFGNAGKSSVYYNIGIQQITSGMQAPSTPFNYSLISAYIKP